MRKIRVGIPTLSPIIAATLVPRDRGYFKQEGLDVETIVIRSAPSVLALAAKEIDFLMTGGGGLSGALRGLPLRVVFAPLRTINLDEQRKALEYLLSPAQQKKPPRLERIYDLALARKAYQKLQARGWKPE